MKLISLEDLFYIYGGIEKSKLTHSDIKLDEDYILYVRPSNKYAETKNGYVNKESLKQDIIYPSETIFCGNTGQGSHTFSYVSECEFVPNNNVSVLIPKIALTLEEKLYYTKCITMNRYKFSYGRIPNRERLSKLKLPHPNEAKRATLSLNIENNLTNKSFHNKKVSFSDVIDGADSLSYRNINLNTDKWKWVALDKIFVIKGSKSITAIGIKNYEVGIYPYITTSAKNNGVQGFYDYYTEEGNVLTVDSATDGTCFYQDTNFSGSDHVEKLIPKFKMNKYLACFLATIINQEMVRYGYGRKFSQVRLKNTSIKLPFTQNPKGEYEPDWQFMEDYIKSLPYSSNLKEETKERYEKPLKINANFDDTMGALLN